MNRDLLNWAAVWAGVSCVVGGVVCLTDPFQMSDMGWFATLYSTALICVLLAALISLYFAIVLYLWDTERYLLAKAVGVFVVLYLLLSARFVLNDYLMEGLIGRRAAKKKK